jgi:gliding motility-associated-like protein
MFAFLSLYKMIQLKCVYTDTFTLTPALQQVGGCNGTAIFNVILCPPESRFGSDRQMVCIGEPVIYADSSIMAPDTWLWTFEGGQPGAWSGPDPPPVYYSHPGIYSTTLRVSNDAGGDTLIKTSYIEVKYGPLPIHNFQSNVQLPYQSSTSLRPCARGNKYAWYPADGLSCTDCENPVVFAGNEAVEYMVIVSNEGTTCIDTCYISLEPIPVDEGFYFPNAFSPNHDGENDVFFGVGNFVQVTALSIYNRWGERLYHSVTNPTWDGTVNGKPQQPGLYIYQAELYFEFSQTTELRSGTLLLLQ